jgi:hypothetical protein
MPDDFKTVRPDNSAVRDGLRDVDSGPNDLVDRALILGAIGALVAPLLPFFQTPFLLWLALFLGFQLYSTLLLASLAKLSGKFDAPARRKLYGAVALNVLGWVELAAVLLFVFRVL